MTGNAVAAVPIPRQYEAATLASGLQTPVAVSFAPDGRAFIAEKRGVVKVVLPGEAPLSRKVIDISDHVANWGDRGLLGIAVDHDFARNGYLYLLYVHDPTPADTTLAKVARLSRITVGAGSTLRSGERVILGTAGDPSCPMPGPRLDCLPIDRQSHGIGTVRSAPDGTLWVGIGDSMWAGSVAATIKRAMDPTMMSGAILHVDRDGRGLSGHPFCPAETDLTVSCTKVWAKGFRNPYRFHLLADGRLVVGDVGWSHFEEINLVAGGSSHGWPCFEGRDATVGWGTDPECLKHPASGQVPPIFQYAPPAGKGASVIMGPQLGGTWPSSVRGRVVFSDYVSGVLSSLDLANPKTPATVLSNIGSAVDIEKTPDGGLAFVDPGFAFPAHDGLVAGSVWTIRPAGASQRPWPHPTAIATGRSVAFKASPADIDTKPSGLSYRWTFGDGTTSTSPNPVHFYARAGTYTARVVISDGVESGTDVVTVRPGRSVPVVTITSPSGSSRSIGNSFFGVSGSATLDGKPLPGRCLTWVVTLRHANHTHDWSTFAGSVGAFKTAIDHDADSHYTVTLRATADDGASASRTIDLLPKLRSVNFTSNVPGIDVSWNGNSGNGPRPVAVGMVAVASAPQSKTVGGVSWRFVSWSDGSPDLQRFFGVPDADTTVTANYVRDSS